MAEPDALTQPIRRLRRDTVYTSKHFVVVRDHQGLPDGTEADWELVLHTDAVHALPFDDEGYVYLVAQYRPAVDAVSLEVPSGTVEPGEEPISAAARELREELGFTARLRPLGGSANGIAKFVEQLHYFFGRVTGRAKPQLDAFERQVFRGVRRVSLAEGVDLCLNGGITQTASCNVILLASEYVRRNGFPA